MCKRFNTQPPEGGWLFLNPLKITVGCFNTQPPEGGWFVISFLWKIYGVSTHSRLKAAGFAALLKVGFKPFECFNTQPPEGGWLETLPEI